MFWTEEMAEKFLTEHYSWFLPVWTAYDMEVCTIYPESSACMRRKGDVKVAHDRGRRYPDLSILDHRAAYCILPAPAEKSDIQAWQPNSEDIADPKMLEHY